MEIDERYENGLCGRLSGGKESAALPVAQCDWLAWERRRVVDGVVPKKLRGLHRRIASDWRWIERRHVTLKPIVWRLGFERRRVSQADTKGVPHDAIHEIRESIVRGCVLAR